MPKTVHVIIYSLYGHIKSLAEQVVKGLEKEGIHAKLFQVPETLPKEIKEKMHGSTFDIPVITTDDLTNADGYIFGFPTRFGTAPAQVKSFWDSTGQLWYQGKLKGKYAGVFTSTSVLGAGQVTTAFSFLPNLVHHGIIYVPLGYHSHLGNNSEAHGGSCWMIVNHDGSRLASQLELEMAFAQGKEFAEVMNRLK